jgi:hypothetical protein
MGATVHVEAMLIAGYDALRYPTRQRCWVTWGERRAQNAVVTAWPPSGRPDTM